MMNLMPICKIYSLNFTFPLILFEKLSRYDVVFTFYWNVKFAKLVMSSFPHYVSL